jgi:hypothetical protein
MTYEMNSVAHRTFGHVSVRQAQITLEAGESYTYEFSSLQLLGIGPSFGALGLGQAYAIFDNATSQAGDSVRLALFESRSGRRHFRKQLYRRVARYPGRLRHWCGEFRLERPSRCHSGHPTERLCHTGRGRRLRSGKCNTRAFFPEVQDENTMV